MVKLRAVTLEIVVALALVLGVAAAVAPAQAAEPVPVVPSGLSPVDTTVSGSPVLSWARGADATSYDVQVARTTAFTNLLANDNTTNRQYVPTNVLPEGSLSWRVRANGPGGSSDWRVATFELSAYGAPAVTGPAAGATFAQPDQVPTFSWQAVRAARGYTIRISTDRQFVDPALVTTYSTAQTSFVPTSLDVVNTYYWQVRADLADGISSTWSEARSYRVLGLQIPAQWTPTAPAMDPVNPNVFPIVQDAVLDWPPVPGADHYELQISTDRNFNTLTHSNTNIVGSRYARPDTLGNDQYYWRVRPVDSAGRTVAWSVVTPTGNVPPWHFRRAWPHQPVLEYPADGARVTTDPFFYQWTGVKHASRYDLQMSTSSTFEPASAVRTCSTVHTTFVPTWDSPCTPAAAGSYYWRVVAHDEFSADRPRTDITLGATPVGRFTYDPARVELVSPANTETVQVPTLTWRPLAQAARYLVTITHVTSGNSIQRATAALSFTPRGRLGGEYRWQVQPISGDGRTGADLLPEGQRRFTVVAAATATSTTPEPDPTAGSTNNTTYTRFPSLQWSAIPDASSYDVRVRRAGTIGWQSIERTEYTATEDVDKTFLAPDSYEWYVTANVPGKPGVVSNVLGRFSIRSPDTVVGYRAALAGTAFGAGDTCAAGLPSECQNLRQTPVLRWDPVADAGYYRLYLSSDPELTNLIGSYEVPSTMWLPDGTLPDSQAGSAYYWEAVPCTYSVCAQPVHAERAFNKLSMPVISVSPGITWTEDLDPTSATVPVLSDNVTLTWRDYLESELDANVDIEPTVLATRPRTEARHYKVQTSTDPQFSTTIDDIAVDQTSFTSFGATYPDGPVYWRVQAWDGSNRPTPWSDTRVFVKRAPIPVVTADATDSDGVLDSVVPQPGSTVSGSQRFAWNALPFANAYEIEVYKLGDLVPQQANRVRQATTRQVGYTPSTPLPVGPYTWRVRRIDARNRTGGWSPLIRFTVADARPTVVSPTAGTTAPPSDALFAWLPVAGAASYLFERRDPATGEVRESRGTTAPAWAPLRAIPGGPWEWRVTAFDPAGQQLGVSEWQRFTVRDRPAAGNPVSTVGSGAVGTLLEVQAPVWDMPDVITTYQWFRGDRAIDGATATSYRVAPADNGQPLTVRATGRRPGYLDGLSISSPVLVVAGEALVAQVAPSISGTPRVGRTLTASPGRWDHEPSFSYQWYRSGKKIDGATAGTYVVTAADAGLRLAVLVTAAASGYGPGQAAATSPTIARLTSRTAVALSANPVPRTARSTASVSVTAPGLGSPLGTVTVLVDGRKVRTARLVDGREGRLDVLLPPLKPGTHTVKAVYAGSTATTSSTRSVKIRATR